MKRTLLGRIGRRLERWYQSLARRVFGLPVLLLQRLFDFRFVAFTTGRIGHLASEPDLFIKEGRLDLRPDFREIVLVRPDRIANASMLEYWAQYLRIVRSPLLTWLLWPFAKDPRLIYDTQAYATVQKSTATYGRILTDWGDRAPLLELTSEHRRRGERVLRELGVPEGAWFVAAHCRESGFAPKDQQNFRNADALTFIPAIEEIVSRGGWCIRLGDSTMKPLPSMRNVVDYALSDAKSDWMDVFLCASARCFLGSASGLANLSPIFGVPSAQANQVPLSVVVPCGNPMIGIPKLVWSETEARYLDFKGIFDSSVESFRYDEDWDEAGYRLVDNTADEILELVRELLEYADGAPGYTPDDERLQAAFKGLMHDGHYSYGAPGRVGRDFLRRHETLLPGG
ncbi:MAG: TIGR04372 family glycosyltransferase [bacterium]|nr:TIGR04372 family glycosyltransferase [bacterium]